MILVRLKNDRLLNTVSSDIDSSESLDSENSVVLTLPSSEGVKLGEGNIGGLGLKGGVVSGIVALDTRNKSNFGKIISSFSGVGVRRCLYVVASLWYLKIDKNVVKAEELAFGASADDVGGDFIINLLLLFRVGSANTPGALVAIKNNDRKIARIRFIKITPYKNYLCLICTIIY